MVDVLAGVAIGMLLGLLIGLTNSPVVAVVVGALASGLMVLLGFTTAKAADDSPAPKANALRLCGFGFTAAVALLIGMHVRTHGTLTPDPSQQIKRLTDSGFTADEAHAWVAYQNAGLLFRTAPESVVDKDHRTANSAASLLFAGEGVDNCALMTSSRYPSQAEQINALRVAGGSFKKYADALQSLDANARTATLRFLETVYCR